jgi:hypothetical protein
VRLGNIGQSLANSSAHPRISSLGGRRVLPAVGFQLTSPIRLMWTMRCGRPTSVGELHRRKSSAAGHAIRIGEETATPSHRSPYDWATVVEPVMLRLFNIAHFL